MAAAKNLAYDLVVIGAGSGGLQAAWDAATLHKVKVAVIDTQMQHGPPNYAALGGTCVNVGCVPKKLLVTGAGYREAFRDAQGFGWKLDWSKVEHNWSTMLEGKNKAVSDINKSYEGMFNDTEGLDFYLGWGGFVDPFTVAVREGKELTSAVKQTITTKHTLVASGGWPFTPDIEGKEHTISSNEAFYLPECPKKALVVGGGYIAVEFASIFKGFQAAGDEVHLAYRGELFLRGFDMMCREELRDQMKARDINLHFGENPKKVELLPDGKTKKVTFESGKTMDVDVVMYATGRKPNTDALNLNAAGVELSKGAVAVNEFSKTNVDHIYAIGDVTDRVQLTPVAINEASRFVSTVYGNKPRAVDHNNIASAVFSIPQIGSCGLTEDAAKMKYKALRVYQTRGTPLMHQLTGNEWKKYNFKILVNHEDDAVVGVHLVMPEAGEVIQLIGVAMKCGVKMANFLDTIGVHPTSSEDMTSFEEVSYYVINGEKTKELPAKL